MAHARRKRKFPITAQILVLSIVLTIGLYQVPAGRYILYPLTLLSTFVHEFGHGISAMLVGGAFDQLFVYADTSGLAQSRTDGSRLSRAFVAAGGLLGPAVAGGIAFVLGRTKTRAKWGLAAVGIAFLLAAILFVRNVFGFIVVSCYAALFLLVAFQAKPRISQFLIVFLGLQLCMSVFSRSDYLFMENATIGGQVRVSDTGAIAKALLLPYWFWGSLIGLSSLVIMGLGVWSYVRTTRGATSKRPTERGSTPR